MAPMAPTPRTRPQRVPALLACCVALALALTGCGGGGGGGGGEHSATLMLDFTPNGVHTGIYTALRRGYDRAAGVRLTVEEPAASTDSVKLLSAGRVQLAVLDIHDLAIADAHGGQLVGVLALVQKPLAAVIAQPGVATPRALEGRTVGVTGAPSDEAVLDSVLAGAGADPRRVRRVDIGFQAVSSMLARRVSAVTAFWDVEGLELRRARPATREFRVDEYGAPDYPELVVCVTRSELAHHRALVRAVVAALVRGYEATLADPQGSIAAMTAEVPGLDRAALAEQLSALRGAFVRPGGRFGELNLPALKAWASWEARFGIVAKPPEVARIFDPSLLPAASGDG